MTSLSLIHIFATRRDTVRIALTKGRLEKKTLALLKAAGYDISELEAGTRKLIFTLPDSGVEIVLSKAADVITYVAVSYTHLAHRVCGCADEFPRGIPHRAGGHAAERPERRLYRLDDRFG